MRYRLIVALLAFGVVAGIPTEARAQTCSSNDPHSTGQWVTVPYQMPINPISATLLHTGQVLIVAGSENDTSNNSNGSESYRAAVWDPTGTTESSIAVQELTYDVFCSGTAALPDGRSLVVGGTSDYSFKGENRSSIFNPATSSFVQSQSMVEIYDLNNAGAGWGGPSTAPFSPPLYPRIALLPNGKVFYSGHGSGGSSANGWIFDPVARSWTVSAPTSMDRSYGSSVL